MDSIHTLFVDGSDAFFIMNNLISIENSYFMINGFECSGSILCEPLHSNWLYKISLAGEEDTFDRLLQDDFKNKDYVNKLDINSNNFEVSNFIQLSDSKLIYFEQEKKRAILTVNQNNFLYDNIFYRKRKKVEQRYPAIKKVRTVFDVISIIEIELIDELETGRYDFYTLKGNIVSRLEAGPLLAERPIEKISEGDNYRRLYRTNRGNLSFFISSLNQVLIDKYSLSAALRNIWINKSGIMNLSVSLNTEFEIDKVSLCIRNRTTKNEIVYQASRFRQNLYYFQINFGTQSLEYYYNDLYIKVSLENNQCVYLRVRNKSVKNAFLQQYIKSANFFQTLEGDYITPYLTQNNCASILCKPIEYFDGKKYIRNEKISYFLYLVIGWLYKKKKIWIIHEKYSNTAQDNGFAFFNSISSKKKNVYFVIKKNSPDLSIVKKYENKVVYFMSIKHLFLLLCSQSILSSESKGHGYVWRTSKGVIRLGLNRKPFVFLQHGVLGLKVLDKTFFAGGLNDAELFVTSSKYEKKIVTKYFGYGHEKVKITGLARWDQIVHMNSIDRNIEGKTIFYMPTWRNWLEDVPNDMFVESDFFLQIYSLISSRELQKFLDKFNMYFVFYVHPKFHEYLSLFSFDTTRISILDPSKTTISEMISNSSLIITDYSSIYWEAIYQKKYTILYEFDLDEYLTRQGMYIDNNELITWRAQTLEEFFNVLNKYGDKKERLQEIERIDTMQSQYFQYIDQQNCRRIYDEVMKINFKKPWRKKIKEFAKTNPITYNCWLFIKRNRRIKKIIRNI